MDFRNKRRGQGKPEQAARWRAERAKLPKPPERRPKAK
jgi:hypothetical protein